MADHLKTGKVTASHQYSLNCPTCTNPMCRSILKPVAPYMNMRDMLAKDAKEAKEAA